MGQKEARRQKRLTKQKQKREVKRIQLARQHSSDPTDRLAQVDRWPILETLVPVELWENGIGQCVIARRVSNIEVAMGVYLVDTYCLGIKNCFWKISSETEYLELRARLMKNDPLKNVSPEYLSKLTHCAADYAQSFGFPPHPDFRHARLLMEGIDPSLCHEEFQFGKDGKPFYMSGPHESQETARAISQRIAAAGGHFLMKLDGPLNAAELLEDDGFEVDDDFEEDDE